MEGIARTNSSGSQYYRDKLMGSPNMEPMEEDTTKDKGEISDDDLCWRMKMGPGSAWGCQRTKI